SRHLPRFRQGKRRQWRSGCLAWLRRMPRVPRMPRMRLSGLPWLLGRLRFLLRFVGWVPLVLSRAVF
ncbi:MAG TPA: hypothetical protein VMU69_29505, partial [Bradyrhizobium sp.]|nr:hypothetical protein [Bradyrhizobium sp.]